MTTRTVMVRIRGDASDLNRAVLGAGKNIRELSNNFETSNDRATWLAQGIAAIVPAVAPIGAQVVPIMAGLTSQMSAAVVAAGTTVLAFQGVGDAMKASLAYEAEPSAANLEKLQQAMEAISPAAREFTTQVADLMPQLKGLRDVAAENMFPGMSEGLDDLVTLLPRASALIGSVAEANGRMASEGAASLAGPEWRDFFDYMQRNAAPTTAELGRTIGNVTKGLADLLMAFEPVETTWSQGMLNMSRSFASWADGVDDTEGFQDFLNYLETTGPQVLDTVGALASMFVEVAEAAAPLGGPTLAIVRGFAEAVSAIADSPIGPVIIGGVAAVSALSRALAVSELLFRKNADGATTMIGRTAEGYKAQVAAIGKLPSSYRAASAAQRTLVEAQNQARTATSQYVGQLRNVNQMSARGEQPRITTLGKLTDSLGKAEMANHGVAVATERAKAAEASRSAVMRSSLAGVGKTAAGVAGLTIATSGLADGMGVSNTATLALMGSIGNIPGIIGGAVVGAFLDARAATKDYTQSLKDMESASKKGDYGKLAASTANLRKEWDALGKADNPADHLANGAKVIGNAFRGNNLLNDGGQVTKAEIRLDSLGMTYADLAEALGQPLPLNPSVKQIDEVARKAAPAMRELGVTVDDLAKMSPTQFAKTANDIREIMVAADSVEGRTKAFGMAVKNLDNDMLSTADSAGQMAAALNALVGPGLSAEEATDKYRASLQALSSQLKNASGFTGNSKGAMANREATRGYMTSLTDMLSKQAEAGASTEKIGRTVQRARREFIAEGVAAGKSAVQMRRRANAIGLTPRLVRTVMQVANAKAVDRITARLRGLPRSVRTNIAANGIPKSEAGIRRLQRRYNLTPKQVRTLVAMRDQTPGVQRKILANLRRLNNSKANPPVGVRDGATKKLVSLGLKMGRLDRMNAKPSATLNDKASGKIASVTRMLNALNGKTARTYTVHTVTTKNTKSAAGNLFGPTAAFAGGGAIGDVANRHMPELAGPGGTRIWREPETKGEAYIPLADDWRRPRARDIAAATVGMLGGQVEWFAQGGYAPSHAQAVSVAGGSAVGGGSSLKGLLIEGTMSTPFGPQQIRGIVRDEIADSREMTSQRGRAGGN